MVASNAPLDAVDAFSRLIQRHIGQGVRRAESVETAIKRHSEAC